MVDFIYLYLKIPTKDKIINIIWCLNLNEMMIMLNIYIIIRWHILCELIISLITIDLFIYLKYNLYKINHSLFFSYCCNIINIIKLNNEKKTLYILYNHCYNESTDYFIGEYEFNYIYHITIFIYTITRYTLKSNWSKF